MHILSEILIETHPQPLSDRYAFWIQIFLRKFAMLPGNPLAAVF